MYVYLMLNKIYNCCEKFCEILNIIKTKIMVHVPENLQRFR